MSKLRIGDRALGRASLKPAAGASRLTRLSAAIASPLGVLTLLPALVALVGVILTLVGQRALRDSNLTMASDRIDEETSLLARSIGLALEQSDAVLDRLGALARERDSSQPYVSTAQTLRDLMQGRAGVSYISISFPDGTFQGTYRDDKDGALRFQDSRVTAEGTAVKRFSFLGHEHIEPYLEEHTDYDPRTRPFYALAVAAGRRVWTKPYPFFKTHYTGITRAEAVFAGNDQLHAVITVDFDVSALSAILSRISLGGATTLLYANDGTLLAYPRGADAIARLPLRRDRALLYADLDDPLLNSFFAELAAPVPTNAGDLARIDVNGAKLLVARKAVSPDPDLPWSVATLIPEAQVLGALHQHQLHSSLAAALATLLASALSWLFARHILRTRNEIAVARAEAREAVARAQELGSYRLVEMLGKGGMGEVWRAEHRLLVRQAAIKLVSLETGSGVDIAEAQERFRREAQSLATLRSRNTIELFDYGVTADGTCFYVMELLDGMDLETLVNKHGAQPAARVIDFLIQACNSLAEAHDADLVHRDIKPANLYVCRVADEVDVIKVLDFGLVRAALHGSHQQGQSAMSSGTRPTASEVGGRIATSAPSESSATNDPRITQVGQAMGTPAYMAPEQALGYELDGRSDLYALGCIGFFLLSGRLVFERSGSLPMMMAHITEPPPELASVISSYVPVELAALLQQCLAKKPEQRPTDARALGSALKAIRIPAAEQWTETQARAWWASRCPKQPAMTSQPTSAGEAGKLGVA